MEVPLLASLQPLFVDVVSRRSTRTSLRLRASKGLARRRSPYDSFPIKHHGAYLRSAVFREMKAQQVPRRMSKNKMNQSRRNQQRTPTLKVVTG